MNQSIVKQFHAALTHLLSEEGRGAQSRLAIGQQIDGGYLNAIVKQRKPGSDKIWKKIADHFNITFEEMLSLGQHILNGENVSALETNKMADVLSSVPNAERTKDLSEFDHSQKQEIAESSIPDKIIQVIGILNAGSGYDCQSALKNDPLSASKIDPPKVKKSCTIPPRNLWLSNQVS